jgi:uncharacterized protein YjbI with pentapeptide repeats
VLDGVFLAGADLRHGWWRESSFRGTRLTGAKFDGAVLEKANFSNAALSQIELCNSNLKDASFDYADLEAATFPMRESTVQALLMQTLRKS